MHKLECGIDGTLKLSCFFRRGEDSETVHPETLNVAHQNNITIPRRKSKLLVEMSARRVRLLVNPEWEDISVSFAHLEWNRVLMYMDANRALRVCIKRNQVLKNVSKLKMSLCCVV